jgi:hypothetical protein
MSEAQLALEWIPGGYAVCRLPADAEVPDWARVGPRGSGGLMSVTRSDRELSIVAPDEVVPAGASHVERGWVALRVVGTLEFDMVGVLARLTSALASVHVPVFCLSTYETDVVFIKAGDAPRAVDALREVADVTNL